MALAAASCSAAVPDETTTSTAIALDQAATDRAPPVSGPTSTRTVVGGSATANVLGLADLSFGDFLEESYRILLLRDPELLTSLGVAGLFGMRNDQLNDYSDEFINETQSIETQILAQLRAFERGSLEPFEQTSYDVYEWYLDQQVRGHPFVYHEWPVHHFVNSYNLNLMLFLQEEHQILSLEDAEDYVSRLNQLERQAGQVIEGLRIRQSMGILPPAVIVEWTIDRLTSDLQGWIRTEIVQPEQLSLYTTFEERLNEVDGIPDGQRQMLLDSALAALEESFAPAWVGLRDYMVSIRRQAGDDAGVGRLPDGEAFYAYLLRQHTSTDLTPAEVHELGLQQVERVEAEMRAAFDALGYSSNQSLVRLRQTAYGEAGFVDGTSPGGVDRVVATHRALIAEVEEAARPLFGIWPSSAVEVVPDEGGGGFYVAGSFDGSRPGLFHAGVGSQVALLTLPSVNYHEAVPGHHTQIAIAQELDLPTFRRVVQYNGFAEGWALYAERLAWEMGLFESDPYGNIGRLELELLRAVRLVVDTGIHSMGWSRAEAHAYMDEVIPTWSHEVERYMVLPGQATGYMIGQQEILRLRAEAEADLGPRFDLAGFHDAVLGSGSLPMAILDRVVADYLSSAP